MDRIIKSIDSGDIVLGVFLDFSKAFDTVNHKILINKMYKYGVRGTAIEWFKSYLTNRKQYVCFNNKNSSKLNVGCGIPQGSVLGSLLFLLYIIDLANVSNLLYVLLFADDTSIFITGKCINSMIEKMNTELKKLVIWLQANKLSLNIDKTSYKIFSLRKKIQPVINLHIKSITIKRVFSIKFLGIMIDANLSWSSHIYYIKNKISKSVGILCMARKMLKSNSLLTLYYSFIYPYLNDCIEIWGSANDTLMLSIFKLQKRAIRIILSASYRAHTDPLFLKLEVLPLKKLYQFYIILFMFKYSNDMLPHLFKSIFIVNYDIHNYNTRQACNLHVQKCNTGFYYKFVTQKGILFWNYISNILDTHCTLHTFKWQLKKYLLDSELHIN